MFTPDHTVLFEFCPHGAHPLQGVPRCARHDLNCIRVATLIENRAQTATKSIRVATLIENRTQTAMQSIRVATLGFCVREKLNHLGLTCLER